MGEAARQLEPDMAEELLREPEVLRRTGLAEATLKRLIRDGNFPKSRRYEGFTGAFWLASEVHTWIAWQKVRSLKVIPPWQPPAD